MGIIYACDDEGVFSNGQLYWDDGEVVDPEDNEYLLLVFRGNGVLKKLKYFNKLNIYFY